MMAYYFIIPRRKVTQEMVNYSTSQALSDCRVIELGKWLKAKYLLLKVAPDQFEQSKCFDKFTAYNLDQVMAIVDRGHL